MTTDKLEFFKTEIRKFVTGGGKLTSGSLIHENTCCALGVILHNKGLPIKNSDEEYYSLFKELDLDGNFTDGFDKITIDVNKDNKNYQLGLAVRSFCENEGWL